MAVGTHPQVRLDQIATRSVATQPSVGSIIYVPSAGGGWEELVISVPAANVRNALAIDNAETTPTWKATLDATTPAAVDAAGSPGTSLVFSHRDHVHPQDAALTALDFLVGTATAELSAEIVVGAAPGGELGGTWAAPTVDTIHSGSAHHAQAHAAVQHNAAALPGGFNEALGTAYLDASEIVAPAAPAANAVRIYARDKAAVSELFYKNDAGTERDLSLGGSAAPSDADYLVGTAQAGLSAEIVVGTTPGGELGGTWATPTVDATHSGSAHHAEAHGASVHTDRTRSLWLYPQVFTITESTPSLAAQGANLVYVAWSFSSTTRQGIGTTFLVPRDWASGALSFVVYWTQLAAGAGNCAWRIRVVEVADTTDLNSPTMTSAQDATAGPGVDTLDIFTHTASVTPSGAAVAMKLIIDRRADDTPDTLEGVAAGLVAIRVDYTADM